MQVKSVRGARHIGQPVPRAIILADDAADLSQVVAGLLAVTRILVGLAKADVQIATITLHEIPDLSARTAEELRRAGCNISVIWSQDAGSAPEDSEGLVFVLGSRAIAQASLLRRLKEQSARCVAVDPEGVPRVALLAAMDIRRSGQSSQLDLRQLSSVRGLGRIVIEDPKECIPLENSNLADRIVLKTTGKLTDGIVSRQINRPISQRLSALILRQKWIRPIHLTVVSALIVPIMFTFLAYGDVVALGVGCILFQIASIADGLDGEIARATFRASARGAALDTAVDMATNLLFVLGLSLGLIQIYDPIHGVVGVAAFAVLLCGVLALTILILKGPGGGSFDLLNKVYFHKFANNPVASALGRVSHILMKRDFFALLCAGLGVTGLIWIFPWLLMLAALGWLGAISVCARAILHKDSVHLLPEHIKETLQR